MSRIALVRVEEMTPEQREQYDRFPSNLTRGLLLTERRLAKALPEVANALRTSGLDPRLREAAILRVAMRCGSAYERMQHLDQARMVGWTETEIAAIEAGELSGKPRDLAALLAFVDGCVAAPRVSDAVFASARGGPVEPGPRHPHPPGRPLHDGRALHRHARHPARSEAGLLDVRTLTERDAPSRPTHHCEISTMTTDDTTLVDRSVNLVRTGPRGRAPVILVHPVGLDLTYWSAQIEALCEDHDVVAFDLPGHGRTPGAPADWTLGPGRRAARFGRGLARCGTRSRRRPVRGGHDRPGARPRPAGSGGLADPDRHRRKLLRSGPRRDAGPGRGGAGRRHGGRAPFDPRPVVHGRHDGASTGSRRPCHQDPPVGQSRDPCRHVGHDLGSRPRAASSFRLVSDPDPRRRARPEFTSRGCPPAVRRHRRSRRCTSSRMRRTWRRWSVPTPSMPTSSPSWPAGDRSFWRSAAMREWTRTVPSKVSDAQPLPIGPEGADRDPLF